MGNVCPQCGGELVLRPRRRLSVEAPVEAEESGNAAVPTGIRPARIWAVSFGVWTFLSLAATATIYEMYHLTNGSMQLGTIAGMEFSQTLTYAPLTPFAFAFAVRYPIQRDNWPKRSLVYLAAGIVFTLGHIALRAPTPYGYWDPAYREWGSALWNSHLHVFRDPRVVLDRMFLASVVDDISGTFLPIVLVSHVVSYYQRLRERELRATQLEGQLTKARLQMLKSQLQPHFLFNTLNSISALMLTDVTAADRMMASLSDLLRMSLEQNGTQLTTLSHEFEFLGVYLEIEKIRLEDRLQVVFDIAPECLDAQVPHLLLQPIVENAVRHGISKRSLAGEIRIIAKNERESLHVWIRDNGPGFAEPPDEKSKPGLGLSVTRERLLALYGGKQSCEVRNVAGGGAEVYLCMPFCVVPQTSKPVLVTHSYS